MIKKLLKYYKQPIIRDNVILFLGNSLGAFFTFLFHFYMGRRLGPEDYGTLGAILALVYLFTIPVTTIQTSIAKFTSNFKAKKKYNEIGYLLKASLRKLLIFGVIATIIFISLTSLISDYLHISISPLFILSPYIIFSFLLSINRGILQGLQRFKSLSVNLIFEGLIKLVLGILFILIGFKLNGAIGAIVGSFFAILIISLYQLKDILRIKIKKFNSKNVYRYTIPVLLTLVSLTAFYSLDILLVKHLFSSQEAGYYVAVSLLAKILFFGSLPISQVMFPKVSELYIKNKSNKNVLFKSILIMLIFILPIILLYFLFPETIINLFYGKAYLAASSLLGWFGIVMGLFSIIYLISFYNLSIHKRNFLYILILFNILEVILIYLFHKNLVQVVSILTILMFILALIMFLKVLRIKDGKTLNNNSSL